MRDITLCHPRLQELAKKLIENCEKAGLKIKIGETFRTKAEQDELYAQGRTKPGSIVTNAPGSNYSSYHQWGTAFDIYRADGKGAYYDKDGFFEKVGAIGVQIGLEWGGNWHSIVDKPHFQLPDWGSGTAGIKKQYVTPEDFMKTWIKEQKQVGWIHDSNGWWYQEENGTYPKNKWKLINHHLYLFNKDGYACTSWHRWNGSVCDPEDGGGDWYYFDPTPNGPYEGACWRSKGSGAQEVWYVE